MDAKQMMKEVLAFWEEHTIFERSIESRSSERPFVFYDGPPFASGDPHYGHLLASTIKDVIPRYRTMRGYRVERKRGRDCHGLPAENYVEKQLDIQGRKQIEEEVGVEKFVEACRTAVVQVNDNWKWFVDHVGRWVDIDNAYFTMSLDFMESVIWVFSDMYAKNLIYKGFKIQGYCPNCATPLSNYEITQGYENKQDPAVTVKFTLKMKEQVLATAREKNQLSDDGCIECVAGIITDAAGKKCMIYDIKQDMRFFPGGKVDAGETPEQALVREIDEELGVEVTEKTLLGQVKTIHKGVPYRMHYFAIEIEGTPTNKEPQKHSALEWAEIVDADTELGFGVRVADLYVEDVQDIQESFIDMYYLQTGILEHEGLADAPMHLLPRTTTPWTLPANMFAAVGEELMYVILFDKTEQEYYIVGEQAVERYYKNNQDYIFIYRLPGKELLGLSYAPLFDYYYTAEHIDVKYYDQVHRVLAADFVTAEDGTGIAHQAPAFGEDDWQLVADHLPVADAKYRLFAPVNEFGEYTQEVPERAGRRVYDANKDIITSIKKQNKLVHQATIDHSYPHCRRCDTPLIYKAIDGWFVKESQMRDEVLTTAEDISFVPAAVKTRFTNGLATAPDRNISRNRFWGSPIPVWECNDCDERVVCGTIAEIEKLSGQKVQDLHKPYIDEIIIPCASCEKDMQRTPEVLDCWFESGAMPYGQEHYIGEDASSIQQADFIAEGLDQTRGWFRTLHVVGNAVSGRAAFKNVIVNGLILAEDGKKMSKRLKNYPDPQHLLNQYGADAFRLYVLNSPVVKGEPLRFMEQGVEQVLKDFVLPLQNVWNFFSTYAAVDNWKDSGTELYFMRHAEKDAADHVDDLDVPLSESGQQQLLSDDFVEKVIRMNPDIIYTSPSVRTRQTALGVQAVMKQYTGKDIEIIEDEKVLVGSRQPEYLIEELAASGKCILIVAHIDTFNTLWRSLAMNSHRQIGYAEIVKLPCVSLENELDQWILAEMYRTMDEVDNYLGAYELEPATRALMEYMDSLTNRYLRRSRRRFRAKGMDTDKQAAYWTLFEVMRLYCQLAAPFAPFVTEHVWQDMQQFIASNISSAESVHLTYRPLSSDLWINGQLIEEIATVRKIIKGAMYLRAKHQIKVKQPLQQLKFKL